MKAPFDVQKVMDEVHFAFRRRCASLNQRWTSSAWAHVELTKNAAEFGHARFLSAVRAR